ncbi:hypothetical protein EJB05_50683, partial [Eragrostis curvula]
MVSEILPNFCLVLLAVLRHQPGSSLTTAKPPLSITVPNLLCCLPPVRQLARGNAWALLLVKTKRAPPRRHN